MTKNEIKQELKELKYYYWMKSTIDRNTKVVPPEHILNVVDRYTNLMKNAESQVYGIFVQVYVENATLTAIATTEGIVLLLLQSSFYLR